MNQPLCMANPASFANPSEKDMCQSCQSLVPRHRRHANYPTGSPWNRWLFYGQLIPEPGRWTHESEVEDWTEVKLEAVVEVTDAAGGKELE